MRGVYSFIFIMFYCCAVFHTAAQNSSQTDSLLAELPAAKADTNKVLLLCAISVNYFQTDPDEGIKYGKDALALATRLKYTYGIVKSNNVIGRCYAVQNKYPEALKYFNQALVTAEKLNNPLMTGTLLISLGAVYTNSKEYDKALALLMRAKEAYEQAGNSNTASIMTNIGHLYGRKKNYAEALKWFLEGIKQEEKKNVATGELATLYNNVGGIYAKLGDYGKGLQHMFQALAIQEAMNNDNSAAFTLAAIGEAYFAAANDRVAKLPDSLKNKAYNLEQAAVYLKQSESVGCRLGNKNMMMLVYSNLAKVNMAKGNYKQAFYDYEKYVGLSDSLRDINEEKKFAKVEAEFFFMKRTDSLKFQHVLKDEQLEQKKTERNGAVALVTLIGAIAILLINRQKLKHRQKRILAEAETTYTREAAGRQLEAFTKNIQEKNELIGQFTETIEKYQALPCSNELPEKDASLAALQGSVILTEEQWINFQALFEKVHAGYLKRIKEKFLYLTPADTRIILLTRLHLNNKEMAGMLGVGVDAIRVAKHRLLKKIQLPEGMSLEEAAINI